jgi:hypothetical protein
MHLQVLGGSAPLKPKLLPVIPPAPLAPGLPNGLATDRAPITGASDRGKGPTGAVERAEP